MKKLSKLTSLALSGAMIFSLAACSGGNQGGASASPTPAQNSTPVTGGEPSEPTADATYNIGICQLVQHPALDAATEGFKAALAEKLGDKVTFDEQNASGDSPTCTTIINGFVAADVDLILANATAPLQSAAAATTEIPILGTSVTDYGTALDMSDWSGITGRNISGTTDLAPLNGQADMIKELFPTAKNVGILYCSAEPNSKYQSDVIQGYLTEMGYTCAEYTFSDSNDLSSVAGTAAQNSDVIYVPTDNTAASNAELIKNVTVPAGVPVVAGEEGICRGCGVATLSINYYDLGYKTGEMAYEILVNGADPAAMEVEPAPNFTKEYNAEICDALKITPPSDYTAVPAAE